MDHEDVGEGDSHKPRRLEEDTITYLMQLDKQLSAEGLDPEEQEILVENVLSEIKQRTASAACDRRTNMIIERLCYSANLPQLLEIMSRCTPYAVFLARNRHSSHILQAILSRLCYILKNSGIGELDEGLVKGSVLGLVNAILKDISWLAKELSASHVVRSAICALAGIPTVSERKGKGSKHQHSVALTEPLESLLLPGKFYIDQRRAFGVPEEFHESLGEAAASLLSLGAKELQSLIADPSSCAVLGILLRVLFTPDFVMGGPDLADRLARVALGETSPCDEDTDLADLKAAPAVRKMFYAMAGDRSGSYFLETVLECCAIPLLLELVHGALYSSSSEYAQDGAGNFVLQACLRRISAELERRTASSAELVALEGAADRLLSELTDNSIFPYLVLSRGGVVLWLLEVARWRPTGTNQQGDEVNWGGLVSGGLLASWTNNDASEKKIAEVLADKLAPRAAAAVAESEEKGGDGPRGGAAGRDSIQQLVARLVGAILKLRPKSSKGKRERKDKAKGSDGSAAGDSSTVVAKAVGALPAGSLRHVATSGPLSRAILDTFLDNCIDEDGDPDGELWSANTLLKGISEIAVELADHYIGQHVLRRAYERCDPKLKEAIVVSLDKAKDKLSTSKEGRNTLRIVAAELYSRRPDEWRANLRKQSKAAEFLMEIEGSRSASSAPSRGSKSGGSGGGESGQQNRAPRNENKSQGAASGRRAEGDNNNDDDDDDDEDEDGNAAQGKRKRKRKRPKKNKPETGSSNSNSNSGARNTSTASGAGVDYDKIERLKSGKNMNILSMTSELEQTKKKVKH